MLLMGFLFLTTISKDQEKSHTKMDKMNKTREKPSKTGFESSKTEVAPVRMDKTVRRLSIRISRTSAILMNFFVFSMSVQLFEFLL